MHGDIKLATLSDTDTTNVTGSELVTNGTFASNTTGWTVCVVVHAFHMFNDNLQLQTYATATAVGHYLVSVIIL